MPVLTKAPLRVLCDGMKGENYWTHGCMAYMAACLGLPEAYHYQFFNCYSGDSVTLLFSKDPAREVRCLSHELTEEGLERDFRALGYSYTYVSGITEETRAGYLERIRESLARGLPVMARGGDSDAMRIEFNCIVGWEEDALLYLFCDKDKAEKVAEAAFTELVFAGEKIAEPLSAADGYREAVYRVPRLLTRPSTERFSFGVQAFYDWAEQLENGSLSQWESPAGNVWAVHGTYLCMLGSNGYGYGLYDQAMAYHADMDWLQDIQPLYAELQDIFEILAYRDGGLCGGFDMKPEDVRRPEKMRPVCEKIRRAAELTQEVADKIACHI